ncbi:ester cyclase [Megamonas hypermegale]|uniref:ester cyclase n=1 Tax=Megamonas hypermegale TaxID=158847 RepID=UPI0026EFC48F|nr:ester cyclase [Megamonas hypermegale]
MINEEETMKNKEIARKFYELIAARKYDEAAKLCSDDFVYYPQVSTRLNGVDKFIDLEKSNMEPAGDFKMETKFIISENDRVAVYLTFEGDIKTDTWHGVKVNDKHVYIDFMTMLRFKDGKIVEKRAKYDRFDILKQLGVKDFNLKY